MKKRSLLSAYAKYIEGQIALASSEDEFLVLANELVKAKDERGMDLFWDDKEEQLMRRYVETSREICRC